MALQESNGYRLEIVPLLRRFHKRRRFFVATRQSVFYFPTKDVRDPIWMDTATVWPGFRRYKRRMLETKYDASRSFPTPKLGAKTRPC